MTVAHAGTINAMHWSSDSQLLALVLTDLNPESSGVVPNSIESLSSDNAVPPGHLSAAASWVQIWHRSNWHWYLKANMPFGTNACGVTAKWDEEQPLRLHLCNGTGGYRQVLMSTCPAGCRGG